MVATKRASAPLFNSYFFVRIVEQWRAISTCFGVLCLVRVGDCPSKMPDAEIENLKAMIDGPVSSDCLKAADLRSSARSRSAQR